MDLALLTSRQGRNAITGLVPATEENSQYMIHRWVDLANASETQRAIEWVATKASDVYFALGAFESWEGEKPRRLAEKCIALRSFWLDIDAGVEKFAKDPVNSYETYDEAFDQLLTFIEAADFPAPTFINSSGAGLHVFWALTEDVPYDAWMETALKLKALLSLVGLKVDPTRTADAASVLRPVGTIHSKSGRVVETVYQDAPISYQTFLDAIAPFEAELTLKHSVREAVHATPVGGIDLTPAPDYATVDLGLMVPQGNPVAFKKIIMLGKVERAGCAQIDYIYNHQDTVSEPLWRAGLSIANFCDDRNEWVHAISSQYAGYTPEETELKASACKGPYTCDSFESMAPDRCKGCPHKGRIKSPIVLGMNPNNMPVIVKAPLSRDTSVEEEFGIPSYPFPYYRKPEGGIYLMSKERVENGDGTVFFVDKEIEVWNTDVYIYERIDDIERARYWCRFHSKHDGVKEFELTSEMVASGGETFFAKLWGVGIHIQETEKKHMKTYAQRMIKQLGDNSRARTAPSQMGWTEDNTFIYGNQEFTRNGPRPAPVNDTVLAKKILKVMTYTAPAGRPPLEVWNELLSQAYPNRPESMVAQYVICAAMGAPMSAAFSPHDNRSGIIHLYSDGTGRGKTAAAQLAMRVFGDPREITFKGTGSGATVNALVANLGYLNSVPLLRDEITEGTAKFIVDLVYTTTDMKTKERMQGNVDDIRSGGNRWGSFIYSTGNTSIWDKVAQDRAALTAVVGRVTEFECEVLPWFSADPTLGTRIARETEKFSGVAGRILIDWLVVNRDEAQRMWIETQEKIQLACGVEQFQSRFWVEHATAVVVGGKVGAMLGLHPFDMNELEDFAINHIRFMGAKSGQNELKSEDLLARFLNSHLDRRLIVSQEKTHVFDAVPRQSVLIRVEDYSHKMWITVSGIAEYCKVNNISTSAMTAAFQAVGGIRVVKRMLSNTSLAQSSGGERAWEIDLTNADARRILQLPELEVSHE